MATSRVGRPRGGRGLFEDASGSGPEEDGFDDHPGLEGGDDESETEEEVVAGPEPASAGVEHLPPERPGGHEEHHEHGEAGEEDWFAATPEVEDGDHEGESGEELIDGAEERPEDESAFAWYAVRSGQHGDAQPEDDGESGRGELVGQRRYAKRSRQFLNDVPLQAGCGIEGGGGEAGDERSDDADGEPQGDADGGEKVCAAFDEGADGLRESEFLPVALWIVSERPGGVSDDRLTAGIGHGDELIVVLPVNVPMPTPAVQARMTSTARAPSSSMDP